MELDIARLLKKGVIIRVEPDRAITGALQSSADALLAEAGKLAKDDPVKSFTRSYDAVFAACRAFMLSSGYRLKLEPDHRTLLQFCELTVDDTCAGIIRQFQAAEIRRHHEMYSGSFSIDEAEAIALLGRASLLVQRLKPAI